MENKFVNLTKALEEIQVKDKYEAEKAAKFLSDFINKIEDNLAQIAIEHEVDVYVEGPYGASRWVLLEDNDYAGFSRGEWQASATSC